MNNKSERARSRFHRRKKEEEECTPICSAGCQHAAARTGEGEPQGYGGAKRHPDLGGKQLSQKGEPIYNRQARTYGIAPHEIEVAIGRVADALADYGDDDDIDEKNEGGEEGGEAGDAHGEKGDESRVGI